MLNNYLYVFNTIWELNLTHWMDWGKLRHVVDDAVRSKLGEQLVETMQYSRAEQPVGYNVTQCYGLSLRGAARNSERARRGRASALAGSAASTSTRAMFGRIDGAPRALEAEAGASKPSRAPASKPRGGRERRAGWARRRRTARSSSCAGRRRRG